MESTRKLRIRALLFRYGFNFWPCIRGTGARVSHISPDFRHIRVKIPLSWRTRNYVGTIFGGSMYAATDPFVMIQLMEILGPDYVVWDKAAAIQFRRPGKETLYVDFRVTEERLQEVLEKVSQTGEADFLWNLELKNAAGVVHATVEKTLYVATKTKYREKAEKRKAKPSPTSS